MINKKRSKLRGSLAVPYLFLLVTVAVAVFPFLWTAAAATHTNTQIFTSSMAFTPSTHFIENYHTLMKFSNVWRNLWNSVFIAVATTFLVCIVDALAGYAFAKFHFKGRDTVFFLCLCSLFIPQQVIVIPQYIEVSSIGLINNAWAVILPRLAAVFGVFLMRQNFMAFPDDLIEAARMDGAGDLRTLLQVVIPTMKPAFASLGILTFVQTWGDYMWPLIVLSEKSSYTLPLVLALMGAGANVVEYGALMVGALMALAPVLVFFLCFQKNFIEGMLSGAIKG